MNKLFTIFIFFQFIPYTISLSGKNQEITNPPIYIAFLWHMHQPIYWPYESVIQTQLNNRYPYSVFDIHNSRTGPYTNWPRNAVQKGINANLPHFGAQVSFSGSLIENLNNLEQFGNQNFTNWKSHWNNIKTQNTSLGNPRIDMVGFGYQHPLMGLIEYKDIRKQIQSHKEIMAQNFSGSYSKGIFPPENAFNIKMIPALVDEGLEWVLIDNIHFDRAAEGYPFNTSGNIYEPNKSDIRNSNPNDWVQLNGLWAPTQNSARWGRQPHYVEYIDPASGGKKKIIAVPADRYMGNEDGRGGFGALNYEQVMSQLETYNTDSNHPILIVLHHDGDNYGGGSESYYGNNFQNFVNWLLANPTRFVCTTIQDYLEMFPPNPNDIVHVESGSWSGADNGDPEFKKWLGEPDATGYSPDRNSWGVIIAAQNFVHTADHINPSSSQTIEGWKYLLNGEASDYWYWDNSLGGIWDSHPTRASNLAIQAVQNLVNSGNDLIGPTIFHPQRKPYNPGGKEWGISQLSDFKVWTYVFDVSGIQIVNLKYRLDNDGINSWENNHNETYIGGSDVGDWISLNMNGINIPSQTNPQPLFKALEYSTTISGIENKLVDYYVEAVDNNGNISRSPIFHVWVGDNSGGGIGSGISWNPVNPTNTDSITITITGATQGAKLHWGVNNSGSNWQTPNQVYWTTGTTLFNGSGPAVESPFYGPDSNGTLIIKIGPFNKPEQVVNRVNFVIHYNDNTWNNNNGQDFLINLGSGSSGQTYIMDGIVDGSAGIAANNGNQQLFLHWNGTELYFATQSAQLIEKDIFVFISDSLRPLLAAPWAKSGSVAGWSTFAGNESSNNWSGWFGNNGSVQNYAGEFFEGTINIPQEFGFIPSKLYLAVGHYQTNDNGILLSQIPNGNSDGNIDQNELLLFEYIISNLEENISTIPKSFELKQNYPNPFNPSTIIKYNLAQEGNIKIIVYDVIGNEIATLINEVKSAGSYSVIFDSNKLGSLSSGIYYYRITAGEFSETKKMIYLK